MHTFYEANTLPEMSDFLSIYNGNSTFFFAVVYLASLVVFQLSSWMCMYCCPHVASWCALGLYLPNIASWCALGLYLPNIMYQEMVYSPNHAMSTGGIVGSVGIYNN